MSVRRRVAVWALVVVASVATVLALVAGDVQRAAVNSDTVVGCAIALVANFLFWPRDRASADPALATHSETPALATTDGGT